MQANPFFQFEHCWYQRHIFLSIADAGAPRITMLTLADETGWQKRIEYLLPEHRSILEQAQRHCAPHAPSERWL